MGLILHCHFLHKRGFMCRLYILLCIWASNLKWFWCSFHLRLCWKWFGSNIWFVFLNLFIRLIVLFSFLLKVSSRKLFKLVFSFSWFKNTFPFRCLFMIFNSLSSRRLLHYRLSFWRDFIVWFLLRQFSSRRLLLNRFSFT